MLAIDTAWVGVVGAGIGGVIGLGGSWLVHRSEREERLSERARSERKDSYSSFLSAAEDSVHRFQWLAEGHFTNAGRDADRTAAIFFYDQAVTPRYMVLKILILDSPNIASAARQLRRAVNDMRHLVTDGPQIPRAEDDPFRTAQKRYRTTRDEFIAAAQTDLNRTPTRRTRRTRGEDTRRTSG